MNPVTTENAGKNHDKPEGSSIMLSQIDTLLCQRKQLEDKGKSMILAMYVLRLAKRQVSGQSDVEH